MKSISDMFRKKTGVTHYTPTPEKNKIENLTIPDNPKPAMPPPYYPRQDLQPHVLKPDEYETQDEQQYRFGELPPMTVLHELADAVEGELTRLIPDNPSSTPIVLKETKYGFVSIVWFKRLMQFTLYVTSTYKRNTDYKKPITQRRTLYGVQLALKDIDDDKYSGIFSED